MDENINVTPTLHPDEYRYRFARFQRSVADEIHQREVINNIYPKRLKAAKMSGDDVEFIYDEQPPIIKQLDDHLQLIIDNVFREIVIEGK